MINKRKGLIRIISFALCCVFILYVLGYILCFNYSFWNIKPFKAENKNSIDVVFIGASEMSCDFIPTYAWEKYGYTSYIYGVDSGPISLVKYSIEEIKKTQAPKLYVVEIYGVTYDQGMQEDEIATRRFIDSIPTSINKATAVVNLHKCDISNYLFNSISKYHENYKEPFDALFYLKKNIRIYNGEYSYSKGCLLSANRIDYDSTSLIDTTDDNSKQSLADDADYYLRDLLDYLKNNYIDNVLFIYNPHLSDSDNYYVYKRVNTAGEIIKQYGFDFKNYSSCISKIGINYKDDFRDLYHLNIMGAEKFTDYISSDVMDIIGTNNTHNDLAVDNYNQSAVIVNEYINKCKECYNNNKDFIADIAEMS